MCVSVKEYLRVCGASVLQCSCVRVSVCVCVPVGREDGVVIQLLKTDRSNRSPVTEFSPRLEGITVKCRGHQGSLALDDYTQSGLRVCVCVCGCVCVMGGGPSCDLRCSRWATLRICSFKNDFAVFVVFKIVQKSSTSAILQPIETLTEGPFTAVYKVRVILGPYVKTSQCVREQTPLIQSILT